MRNPGLNKLFIHISKISSDCCAPSIALSFVKASYVPTSSLYPHFFGDQPHKCVLKEGVNYKDRKGQSLAFKNKKFKLQQLCY